MTNPYSAPELTPSLAAEERRRPKFSRGLLIAYAVHHLFAVLGLLAGVLAKPSVGPDFLPLDNPVALLLSVALVPLRDLLIVLKPFALAVVAPADATLWHWLRMPLMLLIPVAGVMYARSRRRNWLWVIAIVSLVVFLSLVLSHSPPQPLER